MKGIMNFSPKKVIDREWHSFVLQKNLVEEEGRKEYGKKETGDTALCKWHEICPRTLSQKLDLIFP